jgi:hypothetical protein
MQGCLNAIDHRKVEDDLTIHVRNQVLVLWFDCDESLTWRGLNSNLGRFVCFTFIFVSVGESCFLVSWCAGCKCGMVCSDEDRGRSRKPGAEDRGWSHRSGTRWPGDREVGWRSV